MLKLSPIIFAASIEVIFKLQFHLAEVGVLRLCKTGNMFAQHEKFC